MLTERFGVTVEDLSPDLAQMRRVKTPEEVAAMQGADGPAYDAIIGSGRNSIVLYYMAANRRMAAGDMLCLDFGPEVDHYTTDITRSWPIDGVFTPRVIEMYDAVLAAQAAGIAAVRPGRTISDIESACNAVVPKSRAEITGLIAEPGVLDWMLGK